MCAKFACEGGCQTTKYGFREAFCCEDVGKNRHLSQISKFQWETMPTMLYTDRMGKGDRSQSIKGIAESNRIADSPPNLVGFGVLCLPFFLLRNVRNVHVHILHTACTAV